MKRLTIKGIILLFIALLVAIIFIDSLNVFSIYIKNINYEVQSIVVNAIVVIFVFYITYSLVDQKTIAIEEEKKKNKVNTLKVLLTSAYTKCEETCKMLDNNEIVEKVIVPKTKNEPMYKDDIIREIRDVPFKNEEYIINLFNDGIISSERLNQYIHIKQLYQEYVYFRIPYFDIDYYQDEPHRFISKKIKEKRQKIKEDIDKEINYLKSGILNK